MCTLEPMQHTPWRSHRPVLKGSTVYSPALRPLCSQGALQLLLVLFGQSDPCSHMLQGCWEVWMDLEGVVFVLGVIDDVDSCDRVSCLIACVAV